MDPITAATQLLTDLAVYIDRKAEIVDIEDTISGLETGRVFDVAAEYGFELTLAPGDAKDLAHALNEALPQVAGPKFTDGVALLIALCATLIARRWDDRTPA